MAMAGVTLKDAVYEIQKVLLEGIEAESQLTAASKVLSKFDYDDVITERNIENRCGFPLCINPLPPGHNPNDKSRRRTKYRISLKDRKVYDLQDTWSFCSPDCLITSRAFSDAYLCPDRTAVLDSDVLLSIVQRVASVPVPLGTDKDVTTQHKDFTSKMVITEQPPPPGGVDNLHLDFSAASSDAIEGYVPKRKHTSAVKSSPSMEQSGHKSAKNDRSSNSEQASEFTSAIIMNEPQGNVDNLSSHSAIHQYDGSDKEAKELTVKKDRCEREQVVQSGIEIGAPILKSSLKAEGKRGKRRSVKWDDMKELEASQATNLPQSSDKMIPMGKTQVETDSLVWTNLSKSCSTATVLDVKEIESLDISKPEFNEQNVRDACVESAETLAKAMAEAASSVASGELDTEEAVSRAGIYIIPGDGNRIFEKDNLKEEDRTQVKEADRPEDMLAWLPPMDKETFDARECWLDEPPEGFSLELSPFCTMWMAVDGWITRSSVAHIYGKDEVQANDFSVANGREYPCKAISEDNRSVEIQRTLEGCLSRALPTIVQSLRLKVPLSILEHALGRFLNSMSFISQIPPFRTKQWHVIALLFLDALSVHRVPSLSSQFMNNRPLIQMVVEAAEMTHEEYELMKQLLIPLGRCPVFSSQLGG